MSANQTEWVEGCRCLFSTNGVLDNYVPDCPHHAEAALVCSVAGSGEHDPGLAPWERTGVACTKCGQGLAAT